MTDKSSSPSATSHESLVTRLDRMVAVLMDKSGILAIPDDCNIPALMHEASEEIERLRSGWIGSDKLFLEYRIAEAARSETLCSEPIAWYTEHDGGGAHCRLTIYGKPREVPGVEWIPLYAAPVSAAPLPPVLGAGEAHPLDMVIDQREKDFAVSAIRESVTIPRSLAERSHAMFQSVDPSGGIASEWRDALNLPRYP